MTWRTWRVAMADALYGDGGFYRSAGAPGWHFRTAAHTSAAWARAVLELCARVDAGLGDAAPFTVVDYGAGGGELLRGLAATAPEHWALVGVDVAPRPDGLPDRVGWFDQLPAAVTGVVFAAELLDVVPVDVVELTAGGLRLVEVDETGTERTVAAPAADDARWVDRWWPIAEVGDRAEIGRPRDEVWAAAVAAVSRGLAVAVDYGAEPQRDVAGSLTGYRDGRQVAPRPDGSMDLTAHVLLESCAAATDADATMLLTQREALQRLGVDGRRPAYDADTATYLRRLSEASAAAELIDPGGLGGFTWLVQARGMAIPL